MADLIDWKHDNLADVPAFYTGTGASELVPNVFPVAIDGRPYMIDIKSNDFMSGFEPRIRDTFDQATEPGESTINPQGLWRRNQTSWHIGAGQKYADTDATPFRFYKSKGVDPWTKGRLSLLNDTKVSLESSNTNLFICTVESSGTEYVYVADGSTVKYSTNPFDTTPTWTSVTTGSPGGAITGLETNGTNVFIAYTGHDIYYTTPGSSSVSAFYPTSGTANQTYSGFGYAKNRGWASVNSHLYAIGLGSGGHTIFYDNPDSTFRWIGAAAGSNAVYVGGYSGAKSIIFKVTIDATTAALNPPVAALELPVGEVISSIYGYLGFILIGTNKGVRFCSTDADNNLIAGQLIPTSSSVYDFTSEGRFVWFTWSNYDGVSSGLGRLDLSNFVSTNTPAYATDLMYTSTGNVLSVTSTSSKRIFSVAGVGVVVENVDAKVESGNIETGIFRWGIMDRKFIAKTDVRTEPLHGSVSMYSQLDNADYALNGTGSVSNEIQHTFNGSETRMVEAGFKVVLTRSATLNVGPVVTRIIARAYVAPARSQYFKVPLLLHRDLNMWGHTYTLDVLSARQDLRDLVSNPRVFTYQEGTEIFSVIAEDFEWKPMDATDRKWIWDGTATITMRSIQE